MHLADAACSHLFRRDDGACLACGIDAPAATSALAGYVSRPSPDRSPHQDRPLAEVVAARGVQYAPAAAAAIIDAPAPSPAAAKKTKKRYASTYHSNVERARLVAQAEADAAEALVARITEALQSPETAAPILRQFEAASARAWFAEFFRQAWAVIEPSTELVWNWHLSLMCTIAQAVFMDWLRAKKDRKYINKIRNVIFNVPPGSSKSAVFARCFQAWCWLHHPGMKVIALSVNEDATMRDARAMRELIKSPWYQESFKPEWFIKEDQDAVSSFGNSMSGDRLSMPMKSEIVGLRADCCAGSTLVSTERGNIAIQELHEAWNRGECLPRAWSMNHTTGEPELRSIQATRKIPQRETVSIRTETNNVLQCTPDHRIYVGNDEAWEYAPATHHAGRRMSIMQWANVSVENRTPAALPQVSLRDTGVRPLRGVVPTAGSRARQTREARPCNGTVLRQVVQFDRDAADHEASLVRRVQSAVQAQGQEAPDMFAGVPGEVSTGAPSQDRNEALPAVFADVSASLIEADVLLEDVCEQGALNAHAGIWELELLRLPRARLRRRSLGQPSGAHTRARRGHVPSMLSDARRSRVAGASHRRGSCEQPPGEPHHALRSVPHAAPQVEIAAAGVDIGTAEDLGRRTVDVYDIQVEGNHNFFASGLLVHNCILVDDANNPKKSESKDERDTINTLWDTNQYNRVNDVLRSIRIGIQQRTHAADWTGHAIDRQATWSDGSDGRKPNPDGWLHVILPAEFDPDRKFRLPAVLAEIVRQHMGDFAAIGIQDLAGTANDNAVLTEDPRTEPGEALDKVRAPEDFLQREKERWRGTGNYAGQMDQRPAMAEGEMVQRPWFNFFRLARGVRDDIPALAGIDELDGKRPRPSKCHLGEAQVVHKATFRDGWDFDWVTISVDPAAKKTDKGSNYGLLVVAGKDGRRFVLDDRTQRGAFHVIIDVIKDMVRTWRPDTILIEPKAAGPDIMDTLAEQMKKGDIPMVSIEEAEPGNSDKEARLEAALPYVKNGAVYLLDGASWLDDFVDELAVYPNGTRDDRVDALSQVLNKKRDGADHWPTM